MKKVILIIVVALMAVSCAQDKKDFTDAELQANLKKKQSMARAKEAKNDDLKPRSYHLSKIMVKQLLKAPKTAEFQAYNDDMVSIYGAIYTVKAYVDSKNDYGDMVRTHFTVKLERVDNDWQLLTFIYDGRLISGN